MKVTGTEGGLADLAQQVLQRAELALANSLVQPGRKPGGPETGGTTQASHAAGATTSLAAAASPLPLAANPLPPPDDAVSSVLHDIATNDLPKLTQILEPQHSMTSAPIANNLLHDAVRSVAEGHLERAVGYVADFVARAPQRAAELPATPGLEPIGNTVQQLLQRLTTVARMGAEDGLARAEHAIEQPDFQKPAGWETHPEALLRLAQRLFDAGGYANYLRTTDLTRAMLTPALPASALQTQQAMLAPMFWPDAVQPGAANPLQRIPEQDAKIARVGSKLEVLKQVWTEARALSSGRVKALWFRAPLLVLLLGWLGAGLAGIFAGAVVRTIWPESWIAQDSGLGFQIWGLGFLALVGFGFYARVRKTPR